MNSFQQTFRHLLTASDILNGPPPLQPSPDVPVLPTLQPAPGVRHDPDIDQQLPVLTPAPLPVAPQIPTAPQHEASSNSAIEFVNSTRGKRGVYLRLPQRSLQWVHCLAM